MKAIKKNTILLLTLLSLISLPSAVAGITNVLFERSVDLMEQGSNLITFSNSIQFTNEN